MPQYVHSDGLDVLRGHVSPSSQERVGLGRDREVDRGPGGGAVFDEVGQVLEAVHLRIPGCEHEIHNVVLDLLVDVHLTHHGPRPGDVLRRDHRSDPEVVLLSHPVDDLALLLLVRVRDLEFEHKPVDLGLRKRIRPLLFDRILGGQDEKRILERIGRITDRDLSFLHRLQHRALYLRGRAVDLVRQDQVREDRPLFGHELTGRLMVDHGPDQVRRQQIRRKLDPVKLSPDGPGQRADGQCLRQPRYPFEQDVSVREQPDQQTFDHVTLSHDDLADLGQDVLHKRALFPNSFVDLTDILCHLHLLFLLYPFRWCLRYGAERNTSCTLRDALCALRPLR